MIRRGSAAKKHHARVQWLRAHPDAIAGVPGIRDDVTEDNRVRLTSLTATLIAAGLLGGSQVDVQRETVRRLVSELRGERVEKGSW